jgi:hypothetical protein
MFRRFINRAWRTHARADNPVKDEHAGGTVLSNKRIVLAISAGLLGLALSGCVDEGPRMHRGPGPIVNPPHHRYDRDNDRYRPRNDRDWNSHRNDDRRGANRHDRDRDAHRRPDRRPDCKPTRWNDCQPDRRRY